MEIDEANATILLEALRRMGSKPQFNLALIRERIAEVVEQQGEAIFAQLSEAARGHLRRVGLPSNAEIDRLERVNEAVEYGRFLIVTYKVETVGELPEEEQHEFTRLWIAARGGANSQEN